VRRALLLLIVLLAGCAAEPYQRSVLYVPCSVERWDATPGAAEVARERGVFIVMGCR